MKIFDKITPSFLNRFDDFLLRRYLHVWRTKAHYMLYFSILAGILLFSLGYFYPINAMLIGKNMESLDQIKELSFLLAAVLGSFGIVIWWQQIVKHPLLVSNWRQSLLEIGIYFVCLFVLWEACNAFNMGFNFNILNQKNKISSEERGKLEEKNFFVPAVMFDYDNQGKHYEYYSTLEEYKEHSSDYLDQYGYEGYDIVRPKITDKIWKIKYDEYLKRDSAYYYDLKIRFKSSIDLMKSFGQRLNKIQYQDSVKIKAIYLPSASNLEEVTVNNFYTFDGKLGGSYTNIDYAELMKCFLSTQNKIKYSKDKLDKYDYLQSLESKFDEDAKRKYKHLEDSIISFNTNDGLQKFNKEESFSLLNSLSSIRKKDISVIIDTMPNDFFRNDKNIYLRNATYFNFFLEKQVFANRFFNSLSDSESKSYSNYLSSIILSFPLLESNHYENNAPILEKEVAIKIIDDSLYQKFSVQLDKVSLNRYKNYMDFLQKICNIQSTDFSVKDTRSSLWNFRHKKYMEGKKYINSSALDSILNICLPKIEKESLKKLTIFEKFNVISNELDNLWAFSKKNMSDYDKFDANRNVFVKYNYFIIENKRREQVSPYYNEYYNEKNLKIYKDSTLITPDSVLKLNVYQNINRRTLMNLGNSKANHLNAFKENLPDQDSSFLYQILAKNGFMDDASYTFDREYLLSSAYYLQLVDFKIKEINYTFFKDYEYLSWSKKVLLALCLVAFILFVMTSIKMNIFAVLFASFFIVFFNFSIFKIVNSLTQSDPNLPVFLSVGVLGILAIVCCVAIFLWKYKSNIISTFLLIQMVSMLGIATMVLSLEDFTKNSTYFFYSVGLFFIVLLFYRKYLSLPVKR